MDRRTLLAAGTAFAAAGTATTAAAQSPGNQRSIVGSWEGTITAVEPPLGSFNDLISFHPGGIVTESRRYVLPTMPPPFGKLIETTGHGAWVQRGGNTIEAFFRFFMQRNDDSGAPFGTDNVRLVLRLDPATGLLDGTFHSQVKDTDGVVLMDVKGMYSAVPISV